jgi:hypothetical protein
VHAGHWVSYESLSEPWCTRLSLTRRCAIAQTMLYTILLDRVADLYLGCDMHYNSNKNLACGNMMNLDYYEVMAITGDFIMSIISLSCHYSMFSVTPGFKMKTRCSLYVCPGSSCHTYDQNVNTENQRLYYINFITWNIIFTRRLGRLSR